MERERSLIGSVSRLWPILLVAALFASNMARAEDSLSSPPPEDLLAANRFDQALEAARDAHTAALAAGRGEDRRTIELELVMLLSLRQLGRFGEAVQLGDAAVPKANRELGSNHGLTLTLELGYSQTLLEIGRTQEALERMKALVARAREALGNRHPLTAVAMQNLGQALSQVGELEESARQLEEALALMSEVSGADDPMVAFPLQNLGLVEVRRDNPERGQELLTRANRILLAAGGDQPLRVLVLSNLGDALAYQSRIKESGEAYREALLLAERILPVQHPHRLMVECNLAIWESNTGHHRQAEARIQRLVEANQRALGDHLFTAVSLAALGKLQGTAGDDDASEKNVLAAVRMLDRIGDRTSELNVSARIKLARNHEAGAELERAEDWAREDLDRAEKIYGPGHSMTAYALASLADILVAQNKFRGARALLDRALEISLAREGEGGLTTAGIFESMGDLEDEQGHFAESGEFYRRNLAARIAVFGEDSPQVRSARRDVAWNLMDLGKGEEALAEFRLVEKAQTSYVEEILGFTSELGKLRFLEDVQLYGPFGTLGSAPDLARLVLQRKGLALDSVLEDRAALRKEGEAGAPDRIAELREARQRLGELDRQGPEDYDTLNVLKRRGQRAAARKRIEDLEAQLAREFAGSGGQRKSLRVQVSDVQKALPPEAVLIEFIRYPHYLGGNRSERRYGAVLIRHTGEPRWIVMGPAKPIEVAVQTYQSVLRGLPNEAAVARSLADLRAAVWQPLASAIEGETKTLLFSPEGELNFVSFSSLLQPDGRFLVESYDIAYVASGRDLLRPAVARQEDGALVLYGDPTFGAEKEAATEVAAEESASQRRAFAGFSFEPLPGTKREVEQVAAQGRARGWKVDTFIGDEASEKRLATIDSPRILHLATHGFVLSNPEASDTSAAGVMAKGANQGSAQDGMHEIENPMHQSGLALSGANSTLEAWSKGRVPRSNEDGILTAEEVSDLRLQGTWLTILSACDTGLGRVQRGEGVLGLRRGFFKAGTRNLLFTLWPVSDDATGTMMLDFYTRLGQDTPPHVALSVLQRDRLPKVRSERGLFAAVHAVGPFLISLQGPP